MGDHRSVRVWVALSLAFALAAIVTTVATAQSAATGPVVATASYQAIKGPWLLWDKATCGYKTTNNHPTTYRAVLRKNDPPLNVVYTPEATTFPVDPIINGGFKGAAAKAGIKLT